MRLSTILLLAFASQCLYGQGYQRLFYDAERLVFNSCNAPLEGGGFYTVNHFLANGESGFSVIKHEPKGDLTWDRDYLIEDAFYNFPIQSIECQNVGGDTLLIMGANLESAGAENERFLMLIEPVNGEVVWSNKFLDSDNVDDTGLSTFVRAFRDGDGYFHYLGTHNSNDTIGVHYEKYDANNNTAFSQTYSGLLDTIPLNLNLLDASLTVDNGLTAASSAALNLGAVIKWDSMSNVEYSNLYASPAFPINQFIINSVNETRDTGLISTATVVDLSTGLPFAVVFKTDSIGAVEWGKAVTLFADTTLTVALDAIETEQGEYMVVGKGVKTTTNTAFEWGFFLDQDGNSLRQYSYGGPNSFWQVNLGTQAIRPESMDLEELSTGEILLTTTGIETNISTLGPMIIRTDNMGQANCQDTIDIIDAVIDFPVIWDTLDLSTTLLATRDTLSVTSRIYDQYDVPVLSMQDTMYCPQDPIMKLFDATTVGATSYVWSTGDTTPSIVATEEGDYAVTVTMDENICYTLCDTVNVSKRDFPTASIVPDNRYCCDKQYILNAGSSTDFAGGIMWSTMDSSNQITVDAVPGTIYSVTITDSCDNTAEATYSVPANPENVASITIDDSNICTTGTVDLLSSSTSPCNNNKTYLWSTATMDVTSSITVSGPGTYIVTVTDDCGDEAITQIVLDDMLFELPDPEVEVVKVGISSFTCNLTIAANASSGTPGYTYLWEDGTTIDNIEVDAPGTYNVTVTDMCMKEVIGSIVITDADLDIPDPTVSVEAGQVSRTTCGIVITSTSSASGDLTITSTTWNTNESGNAISVVDPGTYEVVVTDNCGQTAAAQVTLTEADFELSDPQFELSLMQMDSSCAGALVVIIDNPVIYNYDWSTGESGAQIEVEQPGIYTVTVSDNCGNSASGEINYSVDVQWPNIFFPSTPIHPENMSFGPSISCPESVSDYSLEIFNRWGKRVFDSEDISRRWTGRLDNQGSLLEEDVYMVQSSWSDETGDQKYKGHVTLVRSNN